MRRFLAALLLACTAHGAGAAPGLLVIVGGGSTPPEATKALVDAGGGRKARIVVVPFAGAEKNAGEGAARDFRKHGVASVKVLDEKDAAGARAALADATAVYLGGGSQRRLMAKLDDLGLSEVLRQRHAGGLPVMGTSAGAAVMSSTMIAGPDPKRKGTPLMGTGLGLWRDAIVDQHYSQRDRENRLAKAVAAHPSLLGVGIDEATAVLVAGREARVIGKATVTVLRLGKAEQVLTAGGRFGW